MSLEWFHLLVTALVGALGFVGVVYTIKKNAELVRQRDVDEQDRERISLRTAIHAELLETRRVFVDRANDLHNANSAGRAMWIPDLVLNSIYENSTGTIGLLTREEIESLVTTYALISELPSRLLLFPSDLQDTERQKPGYLLIDHKNVHNVATMYQSSLDTIKKAIGALEVHLDEADT